jgi:hypothetical protein
VYRVNVSNYLVPFYLSSLKYAQGPIVRAKFQETSFDFLFILITHEVSCGFVCLLSGRGGTNFAVPCEPAGSLVLTAPIVGKPMRPAAHRWRNGVRG